MNSFLENMHVALPEIVLLATACIALLADLFLKNRFKDITLWIAVLGLASCAIISFFMLDNFKTLAFSGLFISDDMAQLMKIFIVLCVILSFVYSKNFINSHKIPDGDYYILGLFSTLGMMVLVSAHSILTVYLGLELLSLPLYAMAAIQRTNAESSEAAMKYFVMGAIASGMLLFGFSLLYGATGKLDLLEIANAIAVNWQNDTSLLSFALVFIIAGMGFKLAAVPFHMWAPDVYEGAPSSVTLFLSAAPKIAALGMTLRVLVIALPDIASQWQQLLLVMTLLSTGLGNLLAVVQTNLKRLFAYSAISHAGYALFGVLAGSQAGYSAALYYVLVYAITSVAAFGLITILSKQGLDVVRINDLKGLNKKNPWLAFMMLIVLFSMAGVPPTVGFFTKLLVLKALVDVQMTWVATLGLFFAVVGAYYYIKIIKVMYFEESEDQHAFHLGKGIKVLYSFNCLALLYLGLFPAGLMQACIKAFTP